MRLATPEFNAMNTAGRRWLQRRVEWATFLRHGIDEAIRGRDVVEIGCGNGYGASLIETLFPRSYLGIDLMPEQIALANERHPDKRFMVGDATNLTELGDACSDVVVIFGTLHHIPNWTDAISECRRILRDDGLLFVEEPDNSLIHGWDKIFHWGHLAALSLNALETALDREGLRLEKRRTIPRLVGSYRARRVRVE